MSWLKKLFGIKEEEKTIEETPQEQTSPEETPQVQTHEEAPLRKDVEECDYCEKPIETWQKLRTIANKKFHKECSRKLRKDAERYAFGNG